MRRMNKIRLLAALSLAIIILLGAGDDSTRVEKLGHKVICMCGCNQVLLECNHYGCPYLTPESKELTAAVDRGEDDSTILKAFVEAYGPMVLAAPATKGFELTAWLLPYLALALGVFGVVVAARSWHKRSVPSPVTAAKTQSPADVERFREQARKETQV